MDSFSIKLLRKVAAKGELTLHDALQLGSGRTGDHRDQFPLALLIEGDYLGCTFPAIVPSGAERMLEYANALTLHIFTLPKKPGGSVKYLGVESSGNVDTRLEKVFLKAKGALYLDEYDTKKKERLFALFLGVVSAYLGSWFATWLD